jgi:4'-phosphopantetheinyl transferase
VTVDVAGAAPRPVRGPDTVQVWLVRDEPEDDVADLLAVLDAEERGRAAAYRSADDRRRYVLAHGALRHVVGAALGVPPGEVRWTRGPHGKPEVAGPGCGLRFNLSHSGEVAMVALTASRAVGVDVQEVLPRLDVTAMARRYFPPYEALHVTEPCSPEARAARFARLWSRKESLVKAHGGRLVQGLRTPVTHPRELPPGDAWSHAYRLTDIPAPRGYRAALAVAGEADFMVTQAEWLRPGTSPPRRG